MTVLPLLFQFEYLLFLFLVDCCDFPILCWIAMVRVGILVLFLNLVRRLSALHTWVLYWLWLIINDFYYVEICSSTPTLVRIYFSIYNNVICFSKIIFHNVMRVFCVTKSTSTTVVFNWEYNTDSDLQNQNFWVWGTMVFFWSSMGELDE